MTKTVRIIVQIDNVADDANDTLIAQEFQSILAKEYGNNPITTFATAPEKAPVAKFTEEGGAEVEAQKSPLEPQKSEAGNSGVAN